MLNERSTGAFEAPVDRSGDIRAPLMSFQFDSYALPQFYKQILLFIEKIPLIQF
jgi:hypothetical protein